MWKFEDLWALEEMGRICLLFNLETLNFLLRRDSNPWPCASQSDPLSTIPNVLMNIFQKISSHILRDFAIFLQQSRQSARRTIGNFIWKDKKHESLITFDLDRIFAWNFRDVQESTMSNFCHIKFLQESCFVKKWITLIYIYRYIDRYFNSNEKIEC